MFSIYTCKTELLYMYGTVITVIMLLAYSAIHLALTTADLKVLDSLSIMTKGFKHC